MKSLLDSLLSPAWWVSVVVVGIGVNLLSAYLKPMLDRRLAGYSSARSARQRNVQDARNARIDRIRSSDRELFLAVRKEHRLWMWTATLFAMSAVIVLTTNNLDSPSLPPLLPKLFSIVGNTAGVVTILLGMHAMKGAVDFGSEIDDAIRER